MQSLGTFKKGDSFAFYNIIKDEADTPIVGKASNLKCQIRDSQYKLIDNLVIEEDLTTPGKYIFKSLDTSKWNNTLLYLDIEYREGDIIVSTDTVSLFIEEDITKYE